MSEQIDKATVLEALRAKAEQLGYREADVAVEELIDELGLRPGPMVRIVLEIPKSDVEDWAGDYADAGISFEEVLESLRTGDEVRDTGLVYAPWSDLLEDAVFQTISVEVVEG